MEGLHDMPSWVSMIDLYRSDGELILNVLLTDDSADDSTDVMNALQMNYMEEIGCTLFENSRRHEEATVYYV